MSSYAVYRKETDNKIQLIDDSTTVDNFIDEIVSSDPDWENFLAANGYTQTYGRRKLRHLLN